MNTDQSSLSALPAGVLPASAAQLRHLASQLRGEGLAAASLDAGVDDKAALLQRLAQAVNYPQLSAFGNNWDAMSDVLDDLSWWPAAGWILLVDATNMTTAARTQLLPTLIDVLADAHAFWRGQGRLFQAFVAR